MLQTLHPSTTPLPTLDPSRHISLLSLSSTLSRLTVGFLSDYLSSHTRRHPLSRIPLLLLLALVHVTALLILGYAPVQWLRDWFAVGSVMVGIGYGGIFTLAPTVVSVVWGVGGFGRNWGILTFSPGKTPSPHKSVKYYSMVFLDGCCFCGFCFVFVDDAFLLSMRFRVYSALPSR